MFRLQRFFSFSSLIILLVTAVLLGIFFRTLSINLLLSDGENKNVATTRVLANSLWSQIEPLLAEEHLASAGAETELLQTQIERLIAGLPVVKIKIYRPTGMTVFSTEADQIGEDQYSNSAIDLARQGQVSNSFVKRDHFNPFDQHFESRDLLQTYLPLYAPGGQQIAGVFEVYSDYTPLLARIVQVQWWVIGGTGLILMLLYVALQLVVRHAEGIITRQQNQLRDNVSELESARQLLEQRVDERTQTLQESNRKLEVEVQQRERMEQIISEREKRLRAVMDNLLNAIVVSDHMGRIESINPSAEKLFGYSNQEIGGKNLLSLFAEDLSCPVKRIAEMVDKWLTPLIETPTARTCMRRNGSLLPAEVAVTRSDHGGQQRYIISFRDLSAQVRAEKELEESRQKLLHQEKMVAIGSLSAGIVHEIGNPIAAIDGLLKEICSDTNNGVELAPEVRADLELIQQQTQRLININRDVSEFSSPQGDAKQLIDFNSLVGRTCRLMRYDARMKEVQLRLDLDPALPAVVIYGDQLIQVLMNLISNAADAVNRCREFDGEIVAGTQLDGERIILSVEDNGTGMDPETAEHALDAFFTTKAPGEGTGLGLSICHSIVALHGGEIEIETALGRGTCVRVLLPVTDADENPPPS
ncbi:MAG: ATP-binding protein [Motiliproteus sp.]